MKKVLLPALLALLPLCIASWSLGQEVDQAACQQTIQDNCTKCHGTSKICKELGEADADWGKIVKNMGKKGKLSQEVQDSVLNCLTKSTEPGKLVCEKK
jgi:hypothetical protein